jgi:methylmalonyl-CoA mutase cobalamin-binding subunit
VDVCDTIIVPAILRAEEDHARDTLSAAKRQLILEHVNDWVDERLEGMSPARSLVATQGKPILCVPASDRADEIIAKLLEAALIERKLSLKIIGPKESIQLACDGVAPQAVVISALPPEAVTAARTVCKRMRKDGSDVVVIVGLWCAAGDLDRSRQRLAAAGATRTVSSFAECFALLKSGLANPAPASAADPPELAVPQV